MNKKGRFKNRAKDMLNQARPDNLGDFLRSESPEYRPNRIYRIEIDRIRTNPEQPRKYFDPAAIKELSASIRQKGVIQPIVLRVGTEGEIVLVAGERRLKAAALAGLKVIPALFTEGDPLEISLIENLQRENLKPVEEAEALQRMIDEHDYTQEKLALVIGKARSTVAEILSINKLPLPIRKELRESDLPRRTLIELAKQSGIQNIRRLYRKIREQRLSSDQVRSISRKRKEKDPLQQISGMIKKLKRALSALETVELDKREYADLIVQLNEFRTWLDEILS